MINKVNAISVNVILVGVVYLFLAVILGRYVILKLDTKFRDPKFQISIAIAECIRNKGNLSCYKHKRKFIEKTASAT
jgi:hypothetical protein